MGYHGALVLSQVLALMALDRRKKLSERINRSDSILQVETVAHTLLATSIAAAVCRGANVRCRTQMVLTVLMKLPRNKVYFEEMV